MTTRAIHPTGADRRVAGLAPAVFVTLGGASIFLGSFAEWPIEEGFDGGSGLFSLAYGHSGMEAGPGLVTAEIGVLLALAGFAAVRRHGTAPFRSETLVLATFAALAVLAYIVNRYVAHGAFVFEPRDGEILVAGGAVVAGVAGARLPSPDAVTRAWALARRPALALLLPGMVAWALGLSGNIGFRVEPLMYAVVFIGLGIGLWPEPLPVTRLKPTTGGLLVLLYGAFWLAAAPFDGGSRGPFEALPFAILLSVAVIRVLDLPIATPRAEPSDGLVDRVLTAIASPSGLKVGALLLTGVALLLLVFPPLSAPRPSTDPMWLPTLLIAGIVIALGTLIPLVRRSPSVRQLPQQL